MHGFGPCYFTTIQSRSYLFRYWHLSRAYKSHSVHGTFIDEDKSGLESGVIMQLDAEYNLEIMIRSMWSIIKR
jgi:hypothetical protein